MIVRETQPRGQEVSRSHDTERTSGANYRELVSIAGGGSATISIAVAQGIGGFSKLVVLKTIREEFLAEEGATKMFMDEARLSARMNHPNVVHVYEVFLRRNVPIIVMEFLEGQPLSAVLSQARATLSVELGVAILIQVLSGLHYVHTLRDFSGEPLELVHRDVSPHNVMVTYDGHVKLVDFGIAKFANSDRTRTGTIKGKLTYMAPEQFIGNVDRRADVFSVGVMLWELATRQRYWGGVPEPALVRRLISGDLPHLQVEPAMDAELAAICRRALAFEVEDRYPSALAMQEDLARYLRDRGSLVTQAEIGQLVSETCGEARQRVEAAIREQMADLGLSLTESRMPPTTAEPEPAPEAEARPERRLPRRWVWLPLAAAAALGAAIAVGRPKAPPADPSVASTIAASRVAEPTANAKPAGDERRVSIRASASPPNATWYLDGHRLDSNPVNLVVPKDSEPHMLRAEAPGHESFAKALSLGADVDVTAVLAPKRTESSRPLARATVSKPATAAVARAVQQPIPESPPAVSEPSSAGAPAAAPSRAIEFGERLERERSSVANRPRKIDDSYPGR